jgi:microcystin-dependent protein
VNIFPGFASNRVEDKYMKRLLIIFALSWTVAGHALLWAIPSTINYQGTLKEKGLPVNGTKQMLFRITSQDGSTVYWSGTQVPVPVANGLFSTQLTPVLQSGYTWDAITPYMEVSVEGQILLPREPINATVYATMSGSIVDHAVTTSKLADGAVTAAKLDPAVQSVFLPAGMIVPFAGSVVPAGWLPCDGSTISRTTYANLFSAIGIVWGGGDGSTTFNLPDLRGRTPIGAGQGPNLTNRTLGQTLGEETHILSKEEMPAHSHGVNDPGHQHGLYFGTPGGGDNNFGETFSAGKVNTYTASALTGISIQDAGGGAAHNNMQPSIAVGYIIKI